MLKIRARKRNYNINQGPQLCTYLTKFSQLFNPSQLLPGVNSYTKFEENRSINAQDTARRQNCSVNQGR